MIIGICGGIGSGKSVVSRILRLQGKNVYDCDSEAKRIMDNDSGIKSRISCEISAEVTDGFKTPDRRVLAEIVFNNEQARKTLNSIVHSAVVNDVRSRSRNLLFVEAAILAESGLADICDRIWRIVAPFDIRLNNIIQRDKSNREEAMKRIKSQSEEERLLDNYLEKTDFILNDSDHSLIEQIQKLSIGIRNQSIEILS